MDENITSVETAETNEEVTTTEETSTVDVSASEKEIAKLKALLSKANSEAANFKRELRAKQSEEEIAKAEAAERQAAMENELNELRKANTINGFKAKYLGLGFDDSLADSTAKALADGDNDAVFANLKVFADNLKKSAVASAMANQSGMTTGSTTPEITKEQFDNMSYAEKSELFERNKELYDLLNGGN